MKATCPKVVTVFGREVRLRGSIDAVPGSMYSPRGEASGKTDGVRVQVARSHSGSFMVRVTLGEVADWKWSKHKVLETAIEKAEANIVKRLVANEERCRDAREIMRSR